MDGQKLIADPKTIGTTYARQFSRPDDAIREREDAERRADLEEGGAAGPQPHPAMSAFAEQEAAFFEDATATQASGEDVVDQAVAAFVKDAERRVEEAELTPFQLQARAFVDELEARGVVLGDAHFHADEDSDQATPEERAVMEAYLRNEDEDEVVGVDENGDTVYRDGDGDEYVFEA